MPFMRKAPKMTGADFLMAMADEAARNHQAYADEFRVYLDAAFSDETLLSTEIIAQSPLKEHEASPVAIILGAHKAALELGDKEAPTEVLRVGMALLARWPYFLVGSTYGHPDFIRKPAP
jgi:hypothetical protein